MTFSLSSVEANTLRLRWEPIDGNTMRASIWNNFYVVPTLLKKHLFKESAKLALEKGYGYFALTDNSITSEMVSSQISKKYNQQNVSISYSRHTLSSVVKMYRHINEQEDLSYPLYDANAVLQDQVVFKTRYIKTKNSIPQKGLSKEQLANVVDEESPVLTTQPNSDVVSWTNKSFVSLRAENWSEAIRTASAAIKIDPNYDQPYINRATAYINHHYLDKATADVDNALKLAPQNTHALNIKGFLLQKAAADIKALIFYEKACKLKLDMACANFKEMVGFHPDNKLSRVHYLLGLAEVAFEQKQWHKVVNLSNQALEYEPNNAKVYTNRSGAYAELGFYDEALADANKAISINPDSAVAYNNRGYAYQLMGDVRSAALEYEISCNMGIKLSCDELQKLSGIAKR